jgi:hypothetical protein
VDVTVTGSEGIRSATSAADKYEYVVQPPSVTVVDPGEGPAAGGTTVTIEGTHLGEADYVEFGNSFSPIEFEEEDLIEVTTPPHGAGTVDLTVIGPYGTRSAHSTADHFRYIAPPANYVLSVLQAGTGSGRISIGAGGVTCESSCSHSFLEGTVVRMSASPQTGSSFRGWSGGGCSGTGLCEFALAANTIVTASFEASGDSPDFPISTGLGTITKSNESSGGGSSSTTTKHSDTSAALSQCLAAARYSYHRAVHAARKGHSTALRRARREETKALGACQTRFGP